MKCKIIRDDIEVSPDAPHDVVNVHAVLKTVHRNHQNVQRPFFKIGAIIEHPQAYWLVRQGMALPADEECAAKCQRSPEQMAAAQRAYERLSKAIHPEDFGLFDAGVITGYDAEGNYLPGPNFQLLEQAAAEAAEIDDTPLTATGEMNEQRKRIHQP